MKFDVVIIGAGPGGLNCAKFLEKSNLKVLILEQNKTIGPKVCAGGVTTYDMDYLKLPETVISKTFDKVKLVSGKYKTIVNNNRHLLYTVDRKTLGQYQKKQLKKTKIKTSSRVTKINKDHIIVNKKEKIFFKYLVGADGSGSITRRYLGLKIKDVVSAFQYIIPTKNKYQNLEVHANADFGAWYAWIFPNKNFVSIGTGCDKKYFSPKKLKINFNKWIKKNNIDISKAKYEAFPINYDYRGYKFKNIFLIGDAAGLASGITGEGIYQALISGEEIAKKILNPKYKTKKLHELIKRDNMDRLLIKILPKNKFIMTIIKNLIVIFSKSRTLQKIMLKFAT